MRILPLLLVLLTCCRTAKEVDNKKTDDHGISFVVLRIHKDSMDTNHLVELVSKIESKGEIKKQNRNTQRSENYLSVYVYNHKNLVDSQIIDHPLYKHLEYLDAAKTFLVKDTVLDQAEFFIRCQTQGNSNEIRISETINKVRKELITIKL